MKGNDLAKRANGIRNAGREPTSPAAALEKGRAGYSRPSETSPKHKDRTRGRGISIARSQGSSDEERSTKKGPKGGKVKERGRAHIFVREPLVGSERRGLIVNCPVGSSDPQSRVRLPARELGLDEHGGGGGHQRADGKVGREGEGTSSELLLRRRFARPYLHQRKRKREGGLSRGGGSAATQEDQRWAGVR